MGDLSHFPCIFLFNHLYHLESKYLFYILSYNPTLYLFCCSKFSSFGHWQLFPFAPLPLSWWGFCSFVLHSSLLSDTVRYSRLILCIPCPSSCHPGMFNGDLVLKTKIRALACSLVALLLGPLS